MKLNIHTTPKHLFNIITLEFKDRDEAVKKGIQQSKISNFIKHFRRSSRRETVGSLFRDLCLARAFPVLFMGEELDYEADEIGPISDSACRAELQFFDDDAFRTMFVLNPNQVVEDDGGICQIVFSTVSLLRNASRNQAAGRQFMLFMGRIYRLVSYEGWSVWVIGTQDAKRRLHPIAFQVLFTQSPYMFVLILFFLPL